MSILHIGLISFLIFSLFGCVSAPPAEQKRDVALSDPFKAPKSGSVFSSYQPANLQISAPLTTLFKAKSLGREKFKEYSVEGRMNFEGMTFPVEIHLKGYSTAIMCPFPKLEITILDDKQKGTPFSQAKTFDLNTHCDEKESSLDTAFKASYFNHREALIYELLDLLKIPSYHARPVFAQYFDEDPNSTIKNNKTYQAFLLEDMSAFKKRIDAREIKGVQDPEKTEVLKRNPDKERDFIFSNISDTKQIDPEDAARIALFQEMIGNYDWFIKTDQSHMRSEKDFRNLWNTKILEIATNQWIIFPQDFSLAATVTGITKPTKFEKVFSLVTQSQQQKIKREFQTKRAEIFQLGKKLDPEGQHFFYKKISDFFSKL